MAPASALVNKIKVQLKLAISRLRMIQQKDVAIAKQQRRAMAQLLEAGKDESARIRVENIIASDITTELYEVLELYCELLLARAGLLEAKECDAGLEEAVKSLIHAAPRTEVRELHQVRQLLVEKYGKEFGMTASNNSDGKVADRVLKRLRVEPPTAELVTLYLTEIARAYAVDWPHGGQQAGEGQKAETVDIDANLNDDDRDDDNDDDDQPASGGRQRNSEIPLRSPELYAATPPKSLNSKSPPVSIVPPKPSLENPSPSIKIAETKQQINTDSSSIKASTASTVNSTNDVEIRGQPLPSSVRIGGTIPNADDLAKRFAALKKT